MSGLLAISAGDPAGIGPEIIGKSWQARDEHGLAPFFAIGDPRAFAGVWSGPIAVIDTPSDAPAHFATALPVLPVIDSGVVVPGQPDLDLARHEALLGQELAEQHPGLLDLVDLVQQQVEALLHLVQRLGVASELRDLLRHSEQPGDGGRVGRPALVEHPGRVQGRRLQAGPRQGISQTQAPSTQTPFPKQACGSSASQAPPCVPAA